MQPEQTRTNFRLLQIYRGWAAMLVVLFHATGIGWHQFQASFLGNYFEMGSAGVDFFFVLSGFLITHIHLKDIGKPDRLGSYARKRFVRIYPAYWVVTLAILPFYWIVPGWGQGDEKTPSVIANSFLLLPMLRGPVLMAGWTLCHEVLFYLVFGLFTLWLIQFLLSPVTQDASFWGMLATHIHRYVTGAYWAWAAIEIGR